MHDPEPFDEDSGGTVFRDVILLALLGFVAIVVLLLPYVKPAEKKHESEMAPGNVVIEARWPDELDADVDLWVQAPGDAPVGYSNKGGYVFNLLRDDLGRASDVTPLNYEISYSRGIPLGEYTVNVHLYFNHARKFPVPVSVVASVRHDDDTRMRQIVASEVSLEHNNQEVTVFRFRLDDNGKLVAGSVHSLHRALRRWVPRSKPEEEGGA